MTEYAYDEHGHLLVFVDRSAAFPHLAPTLLSGWAHVHEDQAAVCATGRG